MLVCRDNHRSGMSQMVSESTSHSTLWFGDEPSESWWVVTSRARRVASDRQSTRHGQGPEELGVIAGVQGTGKKWLLAKDLVEGHRDELTPH